MHHVPQESPATVADDGLSLIDIAVPLLQNAKLLLLAPFLAGAVGFAASSLIPPTYTATTTFLPPQQQQSAAASAMASLGALSGFVGAAGAFRAPGDQYVALMQSVSVSDRLIDHFKLRDVYDVRYRFEARKELARRVRISLGKKDGLISVSVDDRDPQRAADLANRHVDELRRVTSALALTEAQQRRVFFEAQLSQTRDRLTAAQQALQRSGFTAGALRAEPRAAAEGYAKLQAEVTAAEVRLQTLRRGLADSTNEVQQQQTLLGALRGQLAKLESSPDAASTGDYVSKYREFKYQETLFELFSRQYELARLDESREGALIQVVDQAVAPEWKSAPRRLLISIGTAFGAALALIVFVLTRQAWHTASQTPLSAERIARLRMAWRGR